MSDRLEVIKKRYIRETMDYDTAWLIAEVERLRELEAMVSKELFVGDGELTVEQFKAKRQIESLQSQLLGAENLAEHWKLRALTVTSNRNKLQSQLAQMETERNELKADLQTLSGKVRQGLALIDRSFPNAT